MAHFALFLLSLLVVGSSGVHSAITTRSLPHAKPFISRLNPIRVNVTHPSANQIITSIVGGSATGAKSWMVSIGYFSGGYYYHYCGGSLISNSYVLTAGHCEVAVGDTILIGGTDLRNQWTFKRFSVVSTRTHPSFDSNIMINDIAVARLSATTTNVPITLNQDSRNEAVGKSALVTGWGVTADGGTTTSPTLLQVTLPMYSTTSCNTIYGGDVNARYHVCAGGQAGRDSCQGDSGGPLHVYSGTTAIQTGIVSYGYGCGKAGVPGVYTRVRQYTAWLKSLGIPIKTTVLY